MTEKNKEFSFNKAMRKFVTRCVLVVCIMFDAPFLLYCNAELNERIRLSWMYGEYSVYELKHFIVSAILFALATGFSFFVYEYCRDKLNNK